MSNPISYSIFDSKIRMSKFTLTTERFLLIAVVFLTCDLEFFRAVSNCSFGGMFSYPVVSLICLSLFNQFKVFFPIFSISWLGNNHDYFILFFSRELDCFVNLTQVRSIREERLSIDNNACIRLANIQVYGSFS